jgi:hypothetical protein
MLNDLRRVIVVQDRRGRGGAAVEDIIGRDEDRPPGWRRHAGWISAAVVVVALVAAEHLPHGAAPVPRHPSAHGNVRTGVRHVRLRVQAPGVLPPNGKLGRVPPWAVNARLPRTGAQPVWFWPAEGRVVPIRGLPDDRNGYVFTRVGGGWAIQPASCSDCLGQRAPVFYLPDRAGRVTRVGSGDLVAPAAAKGAIWLTSYPAAADPARTPGIARQYTDAGIAVGPAVPLPAGYRITQGTSHGLLLLPSNPARQAITYRLWDPATGKVLRSFQGVVAVTATEVAYEPPCQVRCPVRVLNLRTGRATAIGLPAANTVMAGRFSPDGRFLALEVSANNNAYGASAMRLEVASMPHGHLVVVPHTNVSSDALDGFGWPVDRDELVAEFSFIGQVQTVFWNQPVGGLAVADVSPRQDPFGLVVG